MFTEFYCNASTGSNMSGGSDENTSPSYTATNGGWNSGTGVYTPTSGDPSASVTVGQFAHVFADGATTPTFIGRVTAVNSTTVTVSTTAKSGTAPGTAGTGISINVGGVWKGPNGTSGFPFGFAAAAMMNASSHPIRVNFKNNTTYSITAAMTHAVDGPITFQGYSSTVDDGGRAIIDGGTSGASYVLLSLSSNTKYRVFDMIFQNNGATGSADGVTSIREALFKRCVFANVRGNGLNNSQIATIVECEAYGCNQSNTAITAGFRTAGAGTTYIRCISHDNTGGNTNGFQLQVNGATMVDCIAESNGNVGILVGGNDTVVLSTDCYNNTSHGISINNAAQLYAENCNFVKNGGYGIGGGGPVAGVTQIVNCGFGAGTQANTSGTYDTAVINASYVTGTVTYANDVTPWVDPANGDFRISLAAAKNAGRGTFTQTASSYSGTVGYPDIGAAEHQDSGATPYVIGS